MVESGRFSSVDDGSRHLNPCSPSRLWQTMRYLALVPGVSGETGTRDWAASRFCFDDAVLSISILLRAWLVLSTYPGRVKQLREARLEMARRGLHACSRPRASLPGKGTLRKSAIAKKKASAKTA